MIEPPLLWVFLGILPIVAFLYAGVGHGGASGYLSMMSLFSFMPSIMRPTALLLNLFVAGVAFWQYYKQGHFDKRLFIPFAITSIPLALLGGMVDIDPIIYKRLLGGLLLFSVFKILYEKKRYSEIKKVKIWQGLVVGGAIGFLSGLIGIGGGVILSPIILLFHWGKMKETAAASALFIWVNSFSGLVGQLRVANLGNHDVLRELSNNPYIFLMVIIALMGGFLGGYVGSKKINSHHLRWVLAVVLLLASVKLWVVG